MRFALWPAVPVAVIAEKEVAFAPAAMPSCAGTVTPALSLESVTVAPPEGAAEDSVRLHVAAVPAGTKIGMQLNELMVVSPLPPPPPPPVPPPPVPPPPVPPPPAPPPGAVSDTGVDCEDAL